jgi:hypothetical protein
MVKKTAIHIELNTNKIYKPSTLLWLFLILTLTNGLESLTQQHVASDDEVLAGIAVYAFLYLAKYEANQQQTKHCMRIRGVDNRI